MKKLLWRFKSANIRGKIQFIVAFVAFIIPLILIPIMLVRYYGHHNSRKTNDIQLNETFWRGDIADQVDSYSLKQTDINEIGEYLEAKYSTDLEFKLQKPGGANYYFDARIEVHEHKIKEYTINTWMFGQDKFNNQKIEVELKFDANTGLLDITPVIIFATDKVLYDTQNPFLLNINKIKDTDTTELFNMLDRMAKNEALKQGKEFLK